MSRLLKISREEFIKTAIKQPSLFRVKPETIKKKSDILNYYREIQGKPLKANITNIRINSDESLYTLMLTVLVKKYDNVITPIKNFKVNLIDHIKMNSNKVYSFDIPKNELAQEFIDFVQDFSEKNFGKQRFNITIKE